MFDNLIGNDQVKFFLTQMVKKNTIAHSLLFCGMDGIGKSLFAYQLAKAIICADNPDLRNKCEAGNHPDIFFYKPEGKVGMHSIQSMREFSEEVYLAPFESKRKVFIIHDADRMFSYGANALLKTFEEPSPYSVIILLSSSPSSLLPTILSRCHTIRFQPLSLEEVIGFIQQNFGKDLEEAKQIAALSNGSLGKALYLAKQGGGGIRHQILELFSKGRVSTYTELMQIAKEIDAQVEESKKEEESLIQKELTKEFGSNLSAVQTQSLEKEVEGAVAMRLATHAQALFEVIHSWYRDMHLIHVNGNRDYLVNQDHQKELESACKNGLMLPLETVEKSISDATLSLERSTSLKICLERLFLQLNLL